MNEQNIAQARKTAEELVVKLQSLLAFLGSVNNIQQKGWKVTVDVGGMSIDYVIDNATKTTLISQYNTLKNDLATTYQLLP